MSILLITVSLFSLVSVAFATLPPDPILCASPNHTNCTITNSYGAFPDRTLCHSSSAAFPTSEQDLIALVASATKSRTKIKVATRTSHSIPKLVCPDQDPDISTLVISTKHLSRIVGVDEVERTIVVESGATLKEVIVAAAKKGLVLRCAPYWWGVTVGGMLGSGAHGSSLWGEGSAVGEYVEMVRLISPGEERDGYVRVRDVVKGDPDMDAVKVSLGVLGVISQVKLKLERNFKRSITYETKDDYTLGDDATQFGIDHEFGDLMWYPSQRLVVRRIDNRITSKLSSSSNGLYDFIGFRSMLSTNLALVRISEENQEANEDGNGKCTTAKMITSILASNAYGLTNNGIIFNGYPVEGDHNRLQSSGGCLKGFEDVQFRACPWDRALKKRLFYHQTAFSISLTKVKAFVEDVQRLVELEPQAMCGVELYNGIFMRYVKRSTSYLGKQDDAIDFDITYYRSEDPMEPRMYEDILEEVEQMGIFKYKGLPHWGKNRNVAFEGVIKKYSGAAKFLRVKRAYDPLGLFSNEWTDQILGLRRGGVSIRKEGCALEGLCICSMDAHCAPNKGYFCRPGRIYKEARVCTQIK